MAEAFHVCALTDQPKDIKKIILIDDNNPRCIQYFRSRVLVSEERRKQLNSRHSFLVHPFSIFRTYYELWMSIVFFIALIFKPYTVSFDYYNSMNILPRHYVNLVLDMICLIDIFMTFFTGYTKSTSRMVVMEPEKIAKHYICSIYFISDVLSSLSYNLWNFSFVTRRALNLFYLLKIVRLSTLLKYISRTTKYFRIRTSLYRILIYMILFILVVHWITCIIFLVPQFRYFMMAKVDEHSWIHESSLMNGFMIEDYILTLFRAACLMLGIHTGVYNMYNWEEVILAVLIFIAGKLFILTFTVFILQLYITSKSLQTKYHAIISQLMEYMRYKGLPSKIQERILQLYNYKYSNKYFKENAILTLLSDTLKKEINLHVCKKLIQNVPLFAGLPDHIIGDLLVLLKLEIYLPNEYIIKAGTVGDCMYFLASGTVSVSTPSGKEVCHLQDGAHFGEISLIFTDKNRTATVLAIEICEVYSLDRKTFQSCFSSNPELFRKLEEEAKTRQDNTEELEEDYKKLLFEKSYSNFPSKSS